MASVRHGPKFVIYHADTDSVDRDRVGKQMTRLVAVTLPMGMTVVRMLMAHAMMVSRTVVLASFEGLCLRNMLAWVTSSSIGDSLEKGGERGVRRTGIGIAIILMRIDGIGSNLVRLIH